MNAPLQRLIFAFLNILPTKTKILRGTGRCQSIELSVVIGLQGLLVGHHTNYHYTTQITISTLILPPTTHTNTLPHTTTPLYITTLLHTTIPPHITTPPHTTALYSLSTTHLQAGLHELVDGDHAIPVQVQLLEESLDMLPRLLILVLGSGISIKGG